MIFVWYSKIIGQLMIRNENGSRIHTKTKLELCLITIECIIYKYYNSVG